MTLKQKVEKDLQEAYRTGVIKSQADKENFIRERTAYHRQMENAAKKGGKLALLEFLWLITTKPLSIFDFIFCHPIKTIKALIQAAIIAFVVYAIIVIAGSGGLADVFSIFVKKS